MALSTYADLQTAMTSWLGNSLNSANYPDMINLFEASACRRLRVRRMVATTTLTPSSGSATLPTDYLGWIRATVQSSPVGDLDYCHPSYLQAIIPSTIANTPSFFTIEGGSLVTRSTDTTGIEFVYYQKTAAVSGTLNWLFTNHPDAYLFGSLCEAEAFGVNDERAALWKTRCEQVFQEIERLDFRERGPMAIRIVGAHP